MVSFNYIDKAAQYFMPQGMLKIFLAHHNNRIVGFRIVLTYNQIIYDWYAASDSDRNDLYINDVLPWEVIQWGSKNNYTTFDFGGAGKPNVDYGVRDFKLKFGGELIQYGRYCHINKPILMKVGEFGMKFKKWFK